MRRCLRQPPARPTITTPPTFSLSTNGNIKTTMLKQLAAYKNHTDDSNTIMHKTLQIKRMSILTILNSSIYSAFKLLVPQQQQTK